MLSDMDELPFIKLGEDDVLRFELDPLTAVGKEVALKELRETPENKAQALVELRTLLQGNIPNTTNICRQFKNNCKMNVRGSIDL